MKEKLTPYLKKISDHSSLRRQYFIGSEESQAPPAYNDPLMEDEFEVVKGLIHKYENRALIKVSYLCAAHCRFCTRIRQIGNPEGTLRDADISNIITYLEQHPEIDDVILSGGDPFYTPKVTYKLLERLRISPSVKTLRIGTRMPFQSPVSFRSKPVLELLELITETGLEKPFFILVHVEHPEELTPQAEMVIRQLRRCNVTLLSQSVFLKGINDTCEALFSLFKKLYHLGVIPYYLYHCDHVKGLEHFQVDLKTEKEIAKQLRDKLSGIGCPLHVEDIENGFGKRPVT